MTDRMHTSPDGGETPPASPTDAMASTGDEGNVSDVLQASDEEAGLVTAALASQLAEQQDKYLRLYAEFENFRRRAAKERQESEHRGMSHLLKGLLDTIDDIARFAHVDPASTDAKTLVEGVALVERNLLKSLAGHGLEVVNPVGQPFDPARHEALTTAPAERAEEDGTVAQVYQVGYVLAGTMLRPARVVVRQWNG
ncbi:MAG: GrpE protein [Gemmatimonadota bacterium]|jgi:molecular chaperone GrpE